MIVVRILWGTLLLNLFGCASKSVLPIDYMPDLNRYNKGVKIGPVINNPRVNIPRESERQSCWLLFNVDIDEKGDTSNIRFLTSHPVENAKYIKSAIEYIEKSKYKPFEVNGNKISIKNYKIVVLLGENEIWEGLPSYDNNKKNW